MILEEPLRNHPGPQRGKRAAHSRRLCDTAQQANLAVTQLRCSSRRASTERSQADRPATGTKAPGGRCYARQQRIVVVREGTIDDTDGVGVRQGPQWLAQRPGGQTATIAKTRGPIEQHEVHVALQSI